MRIIKVEKLKNNKFKIITDEENIITFDNVILDNNLLYKKQIDEELYQIIIKDTEFYNIYNKVVKYILKKRRSEKEIKQYLIQFNLNNFDVENMIIKLKQNNLINDLEYCKAFINDSIYLRKIGVNKIRSELLKQDIPLDIIEQELSFADSEQINKKLEKLITKKINLNNKYSNNYLKQKILNEMLDLGYNKEEVLNIIDINLKDDCTIIKKEFEKIYIKLSRKYEGKELLINLKNKMLMKGFSSSEINELIKEKTE